jgi:nucleoside-diphosphate-sugar epimerase
VTVLVLGNKGYIGPVLGQYIKNKDNSTPLIGVDVGWFNNDYTNPKIFSDLNYDIQYHCDIRNPPSVIYNDIKTVVALAAVSNDPMGAAFKEATKSINHNAIITCAAQAKKAGVKRFIFASSCSVYGAGGIAAKTEHDSVAPLTDYAVSKIDTEHDLQKLADNHFQVICLRFATACGVSSRTRLDLVLNDFVWNFLDKGFVEVLSDGSPLRPLIDVTDMSRAIHWALTTDQTDQFEVVNCGYNSANYSVAELASAVADNDLSLVRINTKATPDQRSYRVDFSRFQLLSGFVEPLKSLEATIKDLTDHLSCLTANSSSSSATQETFKRHQALKNYINTGKMNHNLFWL